MQLAGDEGLVTAEDDELEGRLQVTCDARERLRLDARDLGETLVRLHDVELRHRLLEGGRGLAQPGRRVGPEHDAADSTPLVVERDDAVREPGEARVHEVAVVGGIDGLRRAYGRAAREPPCGELVDERAHLEVVRDVHEQGPGGGVDAHVDTEQRLDAATHLLERVAIDDVLDAYRDVADHVERAHRGVTNGGRRAHTITPPGGGPPTHAADSAAALPA